MSTTLQLDEQDSPLQNYLNAAVTSVKEKSQKRKQAMTPMKKPKTVEFCDSPETLSQGQDHVRKSILKLPSNTQKRNRENELKKSQKEFKDEERNKLSDLLA